MNRMGGGVNPVGIPFGRSRQLDDKKEGCESKFEASKMGARVLIAAEMTHKHWQDPAKPPLDSPLFGFASQSSEFTPSIG